jgi:hypothetical protein
MPKNGTVAYIVIPKKCDFHAREVEETIRLKALEGVEADLLRQGVPHAEYDFKTTHGFWANGCESCWKVHRVYEDLGIGRGQKLEAMRGPTQ